MINLDLRPVPMEWKRWFAWHPVSVGDKNFWFCWVERRWFPAYAHDKGYWEYKEVGSTTE